MRPVQDPTWRTTVQSIMSWFRREVMGKTSPSLVHRAESLGWEEVPWKILGWVLCSGVTGWDIFNWSNKNCVTRKSKESESGGKAKIQEEDAKNMNFITSHTAQHYSLATATCPQTEYNPGNIYKDQLPARSCATIFPGKISTSLTIAIFWCLVGKINPYTHLHKKQPVREIPIPYKISKKIP